MKVFIDSSVLIEYEKQTKTELLDALLESENFLFINPIVVSEYLYQMLGILGGRSPMAICESKKIAATFETHDLTSFLAEFKLLPIPQEAIPESISMMSKHNLLPNDALILASCKLQEVAVLASYDSDFAIACQAEGIKLIATAADL